jgi:hypothetical protein
MLSMGAVSSVEHWGLSLTLAGTDIVLEIKDFGIQEAKRLRGLLWRDHPLPIPTDTVP